MGFGVHYVEKWMEITGKFGGLGEKKRFSW